MNNKKLTGNFKTKKFMARPGLEGVTSRPGLEGVTSGIHAQICQICIFITSYGIYFKHLFSILHMTGTERGS